MTPTTEQRIEAPLPLAPRRRPPRLAVMHVCGLNHVRAQVNLREQYALSGEESRALLRRVRAQGQFDQILIVSTCNRTEIYAWDADPGADAQLRTLFLELSDRRDPADGPPPLYQYQGIEATRHLFAVAAGLDSMILGENQIKQQLRQAYEMTVEEGCSGPDLHGAMSAAFATGKRIRTETELNTGTLCVGKAAVLQADQCLGGLEGKTCLVIGAGKIGRIAADALAERQPGRLWIVNRTRSHAEELVLRHGGEAFGLDALPALLPQADFILGAAYAPDLILDHDHYAALCPVGRRPDRVCMVDVAVPRIIDPALATLEGVALFNIEAMEEIVDANRHRRAREAGLGWQIVEEEVERYRVNQQMTQLGPRIQHLQESFERIFHEERNAWEGEPADQERMDALHRRLRQRLLHEVITDMKAEIAG